MQTYKAQTPFRPCNAGSDASDACSGSHCVEEQSCMQTPFTEFDEYNGGIHNGIADHSVAVGLAWQPHAMWSVI